MSILIIDNYDSFTFNLLHYVQQVTDEDVRVVRNDEISAGEAADFKKIIISPGPGLPKDAGITMEVIETFRQSHRILGVCLGHQAIAEVFGARLHNLDVVKHGIASEIRIISHDSIFKGIPSSIQVGRYHSWVIDKNNFPENLEITAIDQEGQIMAIRHRHYNIEGVQFHPESIMTPEGMQMIRNFCT